MKKKASMSLEVVIAGIILLIVLAVVIFIFIQGTGRQRDIFNSTLTETERCLPGQEGCTLFEQGGLFLVPLLWRRKQQLLSRYQR